MFTGSYACPHKTKTFLTKVTLPPVHSTNLTHTETCSCVKTSVVSSPIKTKYSESLNALTICSRIISSLICYLVLYFWGCVFYPRIRYWIIQVRLVFRRVGHMTQNCHELLLSSVCPQLQYFDDRQESIHRLSFVSGNDPFVLRR